MKQELEDKLINTFPELYRFHGYATRDNPCPVSFGVGDGWFPLLWDLSEKIHKHLKENFILPEYNPETPYDREYYILHPLGFAVTDIKEKYAGLRFYYNGGDAAIDDWVHEAENLSEETCENCGKPGEVVGKGWYKTQCYDCATPEEKKQMLERRKEDEEAEDLTRPETD